VSEFVWELQSGNWVQDDERNRFNIMDLETGKVQDNQLGLDIVLGAKSHPAAHPADKSACAKFFPPEFSYCLFCGKKLVDGNHQSSIWVPPFGNESGLRLVSKQINVASIPSIKQENNIRWVDSDKDVFPLPRKRGDYEFIVASLGTKSPVLIAFDRTTGSLDYYSPAEVESKKWVSLPPTSGRRVSESKLPNWSWSAGFVSGKAGFAVPTDEGPVWIAIDWKNAKCLPELGQGECIGGAAIIENQVFIPVLMNRVIAIQGFDFSNNQWKLVGSTVKDFVLKSGEDRYFSVPLVDTGRRIAYWIGVAGLLMFNLTTNSCSWRPWESDAHPCSAVPELGPPYQCPLGNFWQICYDDHDEAFRYYKLSGDESDREDVDGGRFSSGISCFSKLYDLWKEPWVKIDTRQERAKTIRAPLLCLDEESKATVTANFGKGSVSPLLEILKDRGKEYQTELRIESPHELPIELRMPHAFNIHTPWELRLFIYQHHLYVYSIDEAVCYKWRLK
jgi:hypothetical protein